MAVVDAEKEPRYPLQFGAETFPGRPSGQILVGARLKFSGQHVVAASLTDVNASAAGVALDANPAADQHGVWRDKETIRVLRNGYVELLESLPVTNFALGRVMFPVTIGGTIEGMLTGQSGNPPLWHSETTRARSGFFSEPFNTIGRAVAYNPGAIAQLGQPAIKGAYYVNVNMVTRGYY